MASKAAQQDDIGIVVSHIKSRRGLIIVVSAPSGAGKTTVCEKLAGEAPDLSISVSFTTRQPRKGEKDGTHYHFVSKEEFFKERDKGRFLEWAEVHGCYYGTPRDFIEEQVRTGRDTVLDIDVQGARAIRASHPEAVLIFLVPPSLDELKKRLTGRKSDSPRDISRRLEIWPKEFGNYPDYDYLVVNEDVDGTVETLHAIIKAERCRTSRLKK